MTLPAARITDPTVHGGTIVMGFPTVLIGNKPASRITDNHVCPMVTALVPHVGGPLVLGAFTVLTGMQPQSRVTDMLVCVGPPDSVAMGEPTVLVGMAGGGGMGGMLAAMVGAVVAGVTNTYPRTVMIDGQMVTQYNEFITIEGSAEYQATVVSDLDQIFSSPTGQKLLDGLEANGHSVLIQPIPAGDDQANGFADYADPADNAEGRGWPNADGTPGDGGDTVIQYNPSLSSEYTGEDGNTYPSEPHETLGHELIHGLHQGDGTDLINEPDPHDPSDNMEEAQTIGVHGKEDEEISERKFSEEAGKSPRPDHNSITRDVYQDENGVWHDTSKTPDVIPAPPGGGRPNH